MCLTLLSGPTVRHSLQAFNQKMCICTPALHKLTVHLGASFHLSKPQASHLQNGFIDATSKRIAGGIVREEGCLPTSINVSSFHICSSDMPQTTATVEKYNIMLYYVSFHCLLLLSSPECNSCGQVLLCCCYYTSRPPSTAVPSTHEVSALRVNEYHLAPVRIASIKKR